MAPVRLVRASATQATEKTIHRFSPHASFNPLLLLCFCFKAFYAAIQNLFLLITQTGMNFLVRDRNLSVSTEVRDGKAVNSYIFCSSRSYLNSVYPLRRKDHWFAFEGGSMKTNSRRFDLRGNSTNSDEISLHGIQDIVPLSGNCGSKNLNLMAAEKKKNLGFFRGLGPSFWTAVASGISSNKGVELCDEDINLLISGKTPKVPQEHADVNGFHFQIETDSPSDAGTTQENNSASSQTISDTGKPAVQVSKSQTGSNNSSHSSSGGDDCDDGRRQDVPVGSCQQDSQYSVDNSEEDEQQLEEHSNHGGDTLHNQDSMSIPASVPSDTGNSQDKTGTSNQKVGQTPTDEGKPAVQVSKSQAGSNNSSHSSSGGDDGDDGRKLQNVPVGSCQQDSQYSVDNSEEDEKQPEEHSNQGGDTLHNQDSMSIPASVPSDTGNSQDKTGTSNQKVGQTPTDERKPAGQVAKIQQGNTSYQRISSGSGGDDGGEDGKCKLFTGGCQISAPSCDGAKKSPAQLNCHHPEADLHEAGQRLQQAFTCRRHLSSENEWKKCAKASCQEIQEYVSHSQDCRKRVLGGCIKCIRYKEVLVYHVSKCHLPMEACVVEKCDIIRQYMKENRLPDNRKWPYQLDNMFFSPSPPAYYIRPGITREDRGEVIWPLDQQVLSVGEDGSYVEDVHWKRVKYIGGGSCGRCYFCEDAKTGYLFAIKKIPVRKFQQMELDTWGSISGQHPNILKLYGAVKHKETVVIFMEYMREGSVNECGKLDEGQAVHIIHEVISAVEFMHSQRLLHRDITDENVLLDASGQVKLANFGMTIRCDGYLQDNIPRGTQEVCCSKQYSYSIDIWGLMCVFYRMLAGKRPWMEFSHDSLLLETAKASQPPQCPPCSPEVEEFFSRGFVLDPSKRATAAELLQHPVFGTGPSVSNIPLPSQEKILLGKDALRSEEEQLQSLQSDLLLSLEGQDLERALNEIEENADVNDNDINLLKEEDFDVGQFIGSLLGDANLSSLQPPSGAFAIPEGSHSITDLTKLLIKDSEGNLLFTIRERPSTSYGHLGEEHHGNIASVLQLDAFTLTREDGTALNVCAEIGFEEQAIRVVRAHDTDNWQPYRWRVDGYGRVEQFSRFNSESV